MHLVFTLIWYCLMSFSIVSVIIVEKLNYDQYVFATCYYWFVHRPPMDTHTPGHTPTYMCMHRYIYKHMLYNIYIYAQAAHLYIRTHARAPTHTYNIYIYAQAAHLYIRTHARAPTHTYTHNIVCVN